MGDVPPAEDEEIDLDELLAELDKMSEETNEGKHEEEEMEDTDDGMEVDIRNIEHINGNMTVHPNNDHYKFCTNTRFNNWAKNYGLRDEMFYNVPIGKIVDNTIDVSQEGKIESVELI